MKKSTYQSLIDCRFLGNCGQVLRYTSPHNFYKFEDVSNTLYTQLDEEIDFHNIIISFPIGTGYGTNGFYGPGRLDDPRRVLIDHCTHSLGVKNYLHQKGVKFKNGKRLRNWKSLLNRKYIQQTIALIVVQDGIAYINDCNANPWSGNLAYNRSPSFSEIKIDDQDLKILNVNDKQLMFSGFFLRKCEELGMKLKYD